MHDLIVSSCTEHRSIGNITGSVRSYKSFFSLHIPIHSSGTPFSLQHVSLNLNTLWSVVEKSWLWHREANCLFKVKKHLYVSNNIVYYPLGHGLGLQAMRWYCGFHRVPPAQYCEPDPQRLGFEQFRDCMSTPGPQVVEQAPLGLQALQFPLAAEESVKWL